MAYQTFSLIKVHKKPSLTRPARVLNKAELFNVVE